MGLENFFLFIFIAPVGPRTVLAVLYIAGGVGALNTKIFVIKEK